MIHKQTVKIYLRRLQLTISTKIYGSIPAFYDAHLKMFVN